MTDAESGGLRERKKAQTRQALIDVSQRLFSSKGYATTTLEEISEEVGVRTQTLLRYFESKAHLALAPMADVVEDLRVKINEPDRSRTTVDLWREHVDARAIFLGMSDGAGVRRYMEWIEQDAVLVAMTAGINVQTQEYLAAGIAHDASVDVDDLHSTLLAAMLVAGWNSVFLRWLTDDSDPTELARRQRAVIDFAVENMPRASAVKLASFSGE